MARTVLITGSSSGIGRLTAQYFAARDWNVAATARNVAAVAGWASGDRVLPLRLDVTDEATITAAVEATVDRFGAIDALVNNAGYGLFGPLEGVTSNQLARVFQTNVLGAAAVIRAVLPVMRQRRNGTIINVSSIAGRFGSPFLSSYHATKYALEGLSESLRFELALHGIRVHLIEPGHVRSDFFARSLEWADHAAYEPQLGHMKLWVARSGREAGDPAQVAATIFRAATQASSRLRYPVGARFLLTLRAILPDAVWRWLLGAGMHRRPPGPVSATADQVTLS